MTQQNLRARQRELANEFVDKILNDPDFREQVRNDPEAAIRASDKGQEIQELNKSVKTATDGGDAALNWSTQCCVTAIY